MFFYDTCALLNILYDAFKEPFFISDITLEELENIKTSANKDADIKFKAKKLIRALAENEDKFEVIDYIDTQEVKDNDMKIILTAVRTAKLKMNEPITFITHDFSCYNRAKKYEDNNFKVIYSIEEQEEEYTGYIEVDMSLMEMANFYQNLFKPEYNPYNLLINQYLIIKNETANYNKEGYIYKYTEEGYIPILPTRFKSVMFGDVAPKDEYQICTMDTMQRNAVSLVGGPAGSGKTFLSLAYLFHKLEKGKIDRIIIFCNPVGARNTAKLGFYPGTVREKILSTQVGHVLTSKIGWDETNRLMDEGKLEIIPAVDARGYEIPPYSGVYILESQNLTSDTMRMLLQRVSEDHVQVIVDGDRREQADAEIYAIDNGMKKMSEAFRGTDLYGQVDMKTIYRSKIAELAEKMK